MSLPLVSVVIPTHDRAYLLRGAIESVLRQHGGPLDAPGALEVIVVDDASTDDTPAVVGRYGGSVVSLRNDQNRERGASRNGGAAAARGLWLAFLDSDDEWEEGKLAAQLEAVDGSRACLTGSWLIDEKGGLLGMDVRGAPVPSAEIDLFNPYRAVPSSLLIDRALFAAIGGFPEEAEVQGAEDWLFMVKLLRAGCRPVLVRAPLIRYRIHGGNSTAKPDAYLRQSLNAVDWLERRGLLSPRRARAARAQKYEVAARAYALEGEVRTAIRLWRRAAACEASWCALLGRTARAGLRAATHRASRGWLDAARGMTSAG